MSRKISNVKVDKIMLCIQRIADQRFAKRDLVVALVLAPGRKTKEQSDKDEERGFYCFHNINVKCFIKIKKVYSMKHNFPAHIAKLSQKTTSSDSF